MTVNMAVLYMAFCSDSTYSTTVIAKPSLGSKHSSTVNHSDTLCQEKAAVAASHTKSETQKVTEKHSHYKINATCVFIFSFSTDKLMALNIFAQRKRGSPE